MSESEQAMYFSIGTNDNNVENDHLNDDNSTHEDLIRDLTSENIVDLDDVLCENEQPKEIPAAPRNPGGNVTTFPSSGVQEYTLIDMIPGYPKTDGKISTRSLIKADRQDHDYSEIQRIANLGKINDRNNVLNNTESLSRGTKDKMPVSTSARSTARVKNINELKKVTPRVKILSPEVTNLTQLTKMHFSTPENKSAVSREQLNNFCRTCAGLKIPLVDIYSEKGMQMRLSQQMKHLEEINEHDSLSTQMCMDCICDLKMSYKFFMQIKKAQVKLQSIYTSLNGNSTSNNNSRVNSEEERLRTIAPIELIDHPDQTTYEAKNFESDKSEISSKFSSPIKIEETPKKLMNEEQPEVKIEYEQNEDYTNFNQSDNDSIEEFDPDDPSFQSDVAASNDDCPPETFENTTNFETLEVPNFEYVLPDSQIIDEDCTVDEAILKPGPRDKDTKDHSKTVYQYDTRLKAYIKVEPPDDDNTIDSNLRIKTNIGSDQEITIKDERKEKQPNILKRKSTRKNFLGNPVTCVRGSDSTLVRSGQRDMKKPKLNVENALNITNENDDGIMYVTVKGTKPNELLLVKVKKMDKPPEKKEEKKKLEPAATEKIMKKFESPLVKEKNFTPDRSKTLDKREQIIEEQIEEYKKKREKILGGNSGLPNALKFEDNLIRFVNPMENPPNNVEKNVEKKVEKSMENNVRIKIEPSEEIGEIRAVITTSESNDIVQQDVKPIVPIKIDDTYDNAGAYLSRLARLKRKWENAKKKKESLQRELNESYTEGNMEKLARILGEKEKNLADFQEYLKQRRIVITRLKDEDVISLYEDRNNTQTKTNFPDLIDASTPNDYIPQEDYLECDYCPETFALRDVLEEHLKTHDYKLMYWCEDCRLEFPTIKTKRTHNSVCIKKLTCRYCDLLLESKGKKRQHEQKHVDAMYGQLCDVCGEKFKHQATLDQHFKTQHMTWEKVHQCPKCPKKFAFKQKLTFHLKSVHTTLRAYLCEDCGSDFKNPASLRHHRLRKHHPTGNKRECPVCHKLVPFYSLSKHMYTHKAYSIQCPHCDKMFKNSSTLRQHVRIHEDQRQYRCDTCGVGFNRRDGLRLHMRVHQKTDSRALKECSCQICSEKFPNHSMLVIHRNRVHKDGRQYTCHICNRSMLSTRSLEWHMSHIHNETLPGGTKADPEIPPEKKRVSCVHCDKTFKTEMILRTHIKNTHVEKDPTKCLDCEQTFTSDVRLRHHMMVAHNRLEGTLTCPHCPKRFVNTLRLKTHMISHSEDRPYTCEICGFNLKTKIQLIKHHQNRHSDERPLQCRYCPWRCKQVSALVCHERTHTNERPYSCIVCRQRFKYLGDKNKHERRHESLGGSGFKRIVAGRNLKQPKIETEETSTSEQEQIDYENQEDEERLTEEQEQYGEGQDEEEYVEDNVDEEEEEEEEEEMMMEEEEVKFESEDIGEEYEQTYEQEYEETSREASEAAEVIMNMEDTTVYTEEVTADTIESAEIITDDLMTNQILQSQQSDITVVHLEQQGDDGKIQVIPVMLSLPDLSDSSAEVNLATASIMYNN